MQKVQGLVLAVLCLGGFLVFPLRYCIYSARLRFLSPILNMGQWFGMHVGLVLVLIVLGASISSRSLSDVKIF